VCHSANCRYTATVLNVCVLSVIKLNVVMLGVTMLSVIALNVVTPIRRYGLMSFVPSSRDL
jgi:hypothetical protein